MPREKDPVRIAAIIDLLRDRAANAVMILPRAQDGLTTARGSLYHEEGDYGLSGLPFPKKYSLVKRAWLVQLAIADGIEDGSAKLNSKSDREYGEEYEVYLTYLGLDLYIKLMWIDSPDGNPFLELHEIKRWTRS